MTPSLISSQPADTVTGATPPQVLIQKLEREKEKAMASDNEQAASFIERTIKDFKAGGISREELYRIVQNEPGAKDGFMHKPTPDILIRHMEIERQEAIKAGNIGMAKEIENRISDFKSGRITAEEVTSESRAQRMPKEPSVSNDKQFIQSLEITREDLLNLGDFKSASEIELALDSFNKEEISFENLYFIYSILQEKFDTESSKVDFYR